jgi:ArsR family transcriptional regulator
MITHLSPPVADDMETLSAADPSETAVSELGQLFKLLSDETRLWIVHYLSRAGELHVRALCDLLGQSQPAVSHHLALLRVAGLIQLRREGKHNFYRLEPSRFDEMLHSFFSFFPANDEGQIVFNGQALSYGPMEEAVGAN